jgi:spermidine/putrescine transport system permease protein
MKHDNQFKFISLTAVWLWLIFFVVVSFLLIILAGFLTPNEQTVFSLPFTWANYAQILTPVYLNIFLKSLWLALICVIGCLIIGYPFAYFLSQAKKTRRDLLLLFLIIPFWTSSLIRSYAIMTLIKTKGILNTVLLALGIIHHPLQLLFTNTAVIIGLIYNLLPFMILPLYANLEKFDPKLIEAATDLGADWFTTFRRIILPLSMPGIISGTILVLLPAMTLFYIPDLLGGAKSLLIGNLIEYQFFIDHNWAEGCAVSTLLTLLMAIMLLLYWRLNRQFDLAGAV